MAPLIFISLFVFITQGQILPLDISLPTEGYNLCAPTFACELIMPSTVAQCEPVLIYYNITEPGIYVDLLTPDTGIIFLFLYTPLGIGYLEWICDIPAG